MDNVNIENIQQKYQRAINSLLEEDRVIRKNGIVEISKYFQEQESSEVLIRFFQTMIIKNLSRIFDDKVEKHRDMALDIFTKFIQLVEKNKDIKLDTDVIQNVIKQLIKRIDVVPFIESSEEVRLKIVRILAQMVNIFTPEFTHMIAEISHMLSKILTDQYADVKKDSSELIINCSQKFSKYIGYHSNTIFKSLILNLKHQHSKVRKITVQAIAELILTENAGNQLEHIVGPLKSAVNDKILDVRQTSYVSVANCLNGLSSSNLKKWEAQLVSLLINGLNDESVEIVKLTIELIDSVGLHRRQLAIERNEEIDLQIQQQ